MAKDDFYITLLKFIRDENEGNGVNFNSVKAHIENTHPKPGG